MDELEQNGILFGVYMSVDAYNIGLKTDWKFHLDDICKIKLAHIVSKALL